MSSSSEWMQFYQQINTDEDHHVTSSVAFSDATALAIGAGVSSDTVLSPSNDQLTPKGCVSKPVKRRSRASKKTPTTLLNANANNFRELVQQFTGCPSKSFSLGSTKGPVNLSFGLGNEQNQRYEAAFGYYNHYDYHKQSQQLQQQQQQQKICQEQQPLVSFDDVIGTTTDAFSATGSTVINPNSFSMDDDIYFHDLNRDIFSSEGRINDSYFF